MGQEIEKSDLPSLEALERKRAEWLALEQQRARKRFSDGLVKSLMRDFYHKNSLGFLFKFGLKSYMLEKFLKGELKVSSGNIYKHKAGVFVNFIIKE